MIRPKHILLCRTDSIGDVMVTLPLVAWIKKKFPETKISFAGKSYTQAVIEASAHIDAFVNADGLMDLPVKECVEKIRLLRIDVALFAFPDPSWMQRIAEAQVPVRIATAKRWASWKFATHRVWFSRKKSDLHEAQLNAYLLRPIGICSIPTIDELVDGVEIQPRVELPVGFPLPQVPFVILHPKSKGSAVEWGIAHFKETAKKLGALGYSVVITGTAAEGELIRREWDMQMPHVVDATGRLSLEELIALIARADALVAASTGPLHIAAALGIKAIGLYTPQRPMHPGRWAPLGKNTHVLMAPSHPKLGHWLEIEVSAVVELMRI
jgi:heptosyltransferase III